jgi:TPR repeat protein
MAAGGSTQAQSTARSRAAVQLYLQLAERGDWVAQEDLAHLYTIGFGVPGDDAWAAYWFEQAAFGGAEQAKLALAAMYALGRGVERDERLAASWILASNNDHLKGDLYACGMGVQRDLDTARAFYETAAAIGGIDASYQLGTMYANACGAPLDDGKARELFDRAAHAGHPEAQIALSEMERLGLGPATPQPVSAYLWAVFALRRLPAASPSRGRALAARDAALAAMSDEQRMDADWLLPTMLETLARDQADNLENLRRTVLSAPPVPSRR